MSHNFPRVRNFSHCATVHKAWVCRERVIGNEHVLERCGASNMGWI